MKKIFLSLCMSCLLMVTLSAQNVAKECVLFELFTGINCPYCPANANGVAQMLAEELAIAPIAYHTNSYSTAVYYTAETNARASYYNISAYPTTKADGILTQSGGGTASQNTYSQLLPLYNQRIGLSSPFTIDLTYNQLSGDNYEVNCTVNQVGENNSNNLKIMIVVTQSNIAQSWQGMTTLNCVCRDMIPTQNGTDYAGGTQTVTETFALNWPKEDCHLIAWVQDYSTKEVFQAVRLTMNSPDFDYDISLKTAENITTKNCSGKMNPIITVQNEGAVAVTSFDLVAKMDGTEVARSTWNGDAFTFTEKVDAAFDEFTFSFPESGVGELELSIENPNGQPDMNADNSSMTTEISSAPISDEYVRLLFQTDANPSETSVEIINMDYDVVVQRYTFSQANTNNNLLLYFPIAGCYRFVMYDKGGNGITTYFTLRSSSTPPQTIYNGASTVNPFKNQVSVEVTSTVGADDQVFPPVNVEATLNNTNVDLSWEVLEGVAIQPESYNIYRNGSFVANITGTSYSDEMTNNGNYCYSIKSVANNVESYWSEEVCLDVVVLNPPADVATAEDGTDVVVSWSAPATGFTPDSYNIYRNNVSLATGVTGTSYTDDAVETNGNYCYVVKSVYSNNESDASEESCIDMVVLYVPTDLSTEMIDEVTVNLTWNAPTMGYTPQSYNVYRNNALLAMGVTETSYADVIETNGNYCYVVKSVYSNNESDASEESCIDMVVLYVPTDLSAEMIDEANVSLTWYAPAAGYTPDSYNIFRNNELLANTETYSFNDELTEGGEYCYTVSALKYGAESEQTAAECVTSTVNISELAVNQIMVSPNPSKGQFNITTPISGNYQIAIYDANGRKVFGNDSFTDGVINLSHCQKGVYLMTITTKSTSLTKKVVIY